MIMTPADSLGLRRDSLVETVEPSFSAKLASSAPADLCEVRQRHPDLPMVGCLHADGLTASLWRGYLSRPLLRMIV
jgi:hypothetical protein